MLEKGGMPMYPVIVFAGLTLFTWAVAIVASYMDEKPDEVDHSHTGSQKEAA